MPFAAWRWLLVGVVAGVDLVASIVMSRPSLFLLRRRLSLRYSRIDISPIWAPVSLVCSRVSCRPPTPCPCSFHAARTGDPGVQLNCTALVKSPGRGAGAVRRSSGSSQGGTSYATTKSATPLPVLPSVPLLEPPSESGVLMSVSLSVPVMYSCVLSFLVRSPWASNCGVART